MTEATTYTMSKVATYEFKDSAFKGRKTGGHHHHHRRQTSNSSGQSVEDVDPTDGTGSLTYSATSSVQSGASAGESTDSSFADIMRVLDSQEGPELAALIKKEGISASEIREKHNRTATSAVSVASSLNYSTDGESALESALEGSHLIHTITG
jgi:alpha-ketoglutarate-dependent taurine dioxygenase